MKKIKITTLLLSAAMAIQTLTFGVMAAETTATSTEVKHGYISSIPSVSESTPEGNLMLFSNFNNPTALNAGLLSSNGPAIAFVRDDNGGYIRVTNISQSHLGAKVDAGNEVLAGKYLFTGYFRTLRKGELTQLRIIMRQMDKETHVAYAFPTSDEWLKVEYYFELTDQLNYVDICGAGADIYVQDFCFDMLSIVPVDEIPANAPNQFGTPVTKEQVEAASTAEPATYTVYNPDEPYEVQGLIVNQDTSGFLSASASNGITEAQIAQFAKQFAGTHITDYFLSVNDQCSVYPSTTTTSYLDKYYQKIENGVEVDYSTDSFARGAYHIYDELESDFLGIMIEAFEEVGINPWLSFRMNDAHDMSAMEVGPLFTDFYHEHPEIRRIQHHSYVAYMDKVMNYTYDIVREYWLNYINETLNRYDLYGIELDFQRELYLWHIGGEYAGLDILNEFMRQVDDIVAIYEEKYGHKIKIATRVAYDVETNFDFGLDVITWMAEGIVDMMIPASRFGSTDMDLPIRMWDSLTESYDVELAASIEWTNVAPRANVGAEMMDIETASAFAANAFSQGAEKVYLFNRYKSGTNFFTDSDKINTKSTYYTGNKAYWNEYTTLGSYEKCLTMNRRNIIGYKDMSMLWKSKVSYLPKDVHADTYTTFRVPMGDALDGSTATLKFSVSEIDVFDNPPTVYINSVECQYLGLDTCYSQKFTEDLLMCYEVPAEVHGDAYAVIEIMTENSFTTEYIEIYIKAPK